MNPRSLLLTTIAIGSAALGAWVAVKTHLGPQRTAAEPQPGTASVVAALPSAQSSAQPSEPVFLPPSAAQPQLTAALPPDSLDKFNQMRTQLRRAIRERNLVLLRSLVQAGSLREALRNVSTTEPMNFENLDASTWTVLEKAIDYQCLRQAAQTPTEPGLSKCFKD